MYMKEENEKKIRRYSGIHSIIIADGNMSPVKEEAIREALISFVRGSIYERNKVILRQIKEVDLK